MTTRTGGCQCGAVRIEVSGEPMMQALCHCRQCQKNCGGNAAAIVMVPTPALNFLQGELRYYGTQSDSGNVISRGFCSECGTPMLSKISTTDDFRIIKLGAFDDPSFFTPQTVFWTKEKHQWAQDPEGAMCFEDQPPQG